MRFGLPVDVPAVVGVPADRAAGDPEAVIGAMGAGLFLVIRY